jgi:hypothetical protein
VGDRADSRGPFVRETRGRRPAREGMNQRRKRISREDVTDARAGWASRAIWPAGTVQPVGWLGQRPSGPPGRWAENQEKKKFPN